MTDGSRRREDAGTARTGLAGALTGELVGTFILVFFGTGTVVATRGEDLVAIALAFGFAVLVVIYAVGHASGAHINPAVTVALAAIGKFPLRAVPLYVAAQLAGAVLASLAVLALFGDAGSDAPLLLGVTAPGAGFSAADALLAELIITAVLLVVIVGTATDVRASAPVVGLGVGLTVVAGIFATAPVSGGSFNPARSLAPMLVSGEFPSWAVYVIGPVGGAVLGAVLYDRVIRTGAPPDREGAVEESPRSDVA